MFIARATSARGAVTRSRAASPSLATRRSVAPQDGRGLRLPWGAPMFACHKSPEGGERACASWLAKVGEEHIGVRLAVVMGRLDPAALEPKPDWPPLFDSYEEMVWSQNYDS